MGLDLFLGDASIIDISDIKLPSPVTAELLEQRSGGNIGKNKYYQVNDTFKRR